MGGVYKLRRSDVLRCHDTDTKFYKDWFRHLKIDRWARSHKTYRRRGDLISRLLFFRNKGSKLKLSKPVVLELLPTDGFTQQFDRLFHGNGNRNRFFLIVKIS
jgi:hypothetical protein